MEDPTRSNFLTDIIDADLASGRHSRIKTRFPPEPNGYPHIGHAKSIFLNHGLAQRYEGDFNLRFDDTNPAAEKDEYVRAIIRDVKWLLELDELENIFFASDYFEQMYGFAVELVQKGLAYVDSQSVEEVRANRGDFNTPGTPSPYRDRSIDENLDLLARMRAGEFPDGAHVLRAKIDLAHPNMIMRDPLLYRIKHEHHHNTGDAWCIYPMYDFAHCLEDAIEGITHSICTLEFENNREIYDWLIDNVSVPHRPRQYEFARLALDYTVMSKRRLKILVDDGHVSGWDDPRMPTISAMRRRGIRPAALRRFCDLIGVAKTNSVVDVGKFEFAVRDDLNAGAPRTFAVLEPLEVVLEGVDDDFAAAVDAPLIPDDFEGLTRPLVLRKRLAIERSDFALDPPSGFKRLSPGGVVRLRYASAIRCDAVERGPDGQIARLRCSLVDPAEAERAGVIHWLSLDDAVPAEVRLYDRLFRVPNPGADPEVNFIDELNPESLVVRPDALVEPWLRDATIGSDAERRASGDPTVRVQFERLGYFCPDIETTPDRLIFNRIVTLKDSWARQNDANEEDFDTLRLEKERFKAEQAARSAAAKRAPADLAAERGADVLAGFRRLVAAGVGDDDALALATAGPDRVELVAAAGSFAAYPAETATYCVNYTLPAWPEAQPAPYGPDALGALVADVAAGRISGADAKRIHAHMVETGNYDPEVVPRIDADELVRVVDAVLADNADAVQRYRAGKTQLLGFFVGQVMQRTAGGADAAELRALLVRKLGA